MSNLQIKVQSSYYPDKDLPFNEWVEELHKKMTGREHVLKPCQSDTDISPKDKLLNLANDFTLAGQDDVAVKLYDIYNEL
jgi:hypothetical protein